MKKIKIIEALTTIRPIAEALNVSQEEITTLIGRLTEMSNRGISGAEAGKQLRKELKELQSE